MNLVNIHPHIFYSIKIGPKLRISNLTLISPKIVGSRTMCYPPIMAQQKQNSIKSFFSAQKRLKLATDEMEDHSEGENSDLEQDDIVRQMIWTLILRVIVSHMVLVVQ